MPITKDTVANLRRIETGSDETHGDEARDPAEPETVEELRRDIDSGATGEKVGFPDPAAAPLGADDEAAGTPPNRAEMQAARARGAAEATGAAHPQVPGVDHSAGEAGSPADMDYYRTDARTGSKLTLNVLAMPIVLLLLIVFGAIWYWL